MQADSGLGPPGKEEEMAGPKSITLTEAVQSEPIYQALGGGRPPAIMDVRADGDIPWGFIHVIDTERDPADQLAPIPIGTDRRVTIPRARTIVMRYEKTDPGAPPEINVMYEYA
jgi:hypothetical protein